MDGSNADNPGIDTTTGEEENTSVDVSSSNIDDNNATDDQFLDGLEESDKNDGSKDTDNNSEKQEEISNKIQESNNSDEKPVSDSKSSGRPDKRQRQINDLMMANAKKDAELEQLRQFAVQHDQPQLPEGDEDGNVTVEQMAEYQRMVASEAAKQQFEELEQRVLQAEDQRNQAESLSAIDRITTNARSMHKVLDESNPSYNPRVDAFVKERVKDAITPYIATNSRDYGAIVDTVEATIVDSMKFYEEVGAVSANNARNNLDSLKNSTALVSQDVGDSSVDEDDDFLKGFMTD